MGRYRHLVTEESRHSRTRAHRDGEQCRRGVSGSLPSTAVVHRREVERPVPAPADAEPREPTDRTQSEVDVRHNQLSVSKWPG